MLAYYLSSVVGDGTSPETSYRSYAASQLASLGAASSINEEIKEDANSKPTALQTLAIVGATVATQATVAADVNNYQLPFSPAQLDSALSTVLNASGLSAMNAAISARGFSAAAWIISDNCRKVVDGLLSQLGCTCDATTFTTTDVAG